MEGIEYKEDLPALRNGSTIPFTFFFIDYVDGSRILRLNEQVTLTWSQEYNRCTLPKQDCTIAEEVEEDTATMLSTLAASTIAIISLLAF